MIVFNGFWTGLIVGVLVGIVGMCLYALRVSEHRRREVENEGAG